MGKRPMSLAVAQWIGIALGVLAVFLLAVATPGCGTFGPDLDELTAMCEASGDDSSQVCEQMRVRERIVQAAAERRWRKDHMQCHEPRPHKDCDNFDCVCHTREEHERYMEPVRRQMDAMRGFY